MQPEAGPVAPIPADLDAAGMFGRHRHEQRRAERRHRAIVDEAVLAESLGFDSVWLGEHHACDTVLAAPPVVLAAIAARTSRIRLGTVVTLLANLDPLRVAEDYATVDAISNGRVELSVVEVIVVEVIVVEVIDVGEFGVRGFVTHARYPTEHN